MALLVRSGFSEEYVLHRTTVRIFQVMVATVMKQRMEELKALTMGIQMTIGSMLSEDARTASKSYQEEMEKLLDDMQRKAYGQSEEEIEELAVAAAVIDKAVKERLTEAEMARKGLITAIKADAVFKKLTGVHQTLPTLANVNNASMVRTMSWQQIERAAAGQADALMRQNDQIAKRLLAHGPTEKKIRVGTGITGW